MPRRHRVLLPLAASWLSPASAWFLVRGCVPGAVSSCGAEVLPAKRVSPAPARGC